MGRDRHHQQRVAVGRGLGRHVGADAAAGARPVLDNDLLAQRLAELLGGHARQDVGRLAGRGRDDDAQRLGRPSLWARDGEGKCERRGEDRCDESFIVSSRVERAHPERS